METKRRASVWVKSQRQADLRPRLQALINPATFSSLSGTKGAMLVLCWIALLIFLSFLHLLLIEVTHILTFNFTLSIKLFLERSVLKFWLLFATKILVNIYSGWCTRPSSGCGFFDRSSYPPHSWHGYQFDCNAIIPPSESPRAAPLHMVPKVNTGDCCPMGSLRAL